MSAELVAPDGAPGPHPSRRRVAAWALWDWGSAAFNAVTTTFVFTVWLTSSQFIDDRTLVARRDADLAAGLTRSPAIDAVAHQLAAHSTWLGWGLGVAGLLVAIFAPALGKHSDRNGTRRRNLVICTLATVVGLASLWFVRPAEAWIIPAIAIVAIANIAYELGDVEYNAMLPEVSTPATAGRVSGIGWGAGYLGGIVLLLIVLVAFIEPAVGLFGTGDADGTRYRAVELLCAVWMLLSSLPLLLGRRRGRRRRTPSDTHPRLGLFATYRELTRDLRGLWRTDRTLVWFLAASAVYRDGLTGVFTFGGVIAAGSFGFSSSLVIVFAIVANVVAGLATVALGFAEDRVGPRRIILLSLICMVVFAVAVFVLHGYGSWVFWAFGLLLCVFVGPVQSASRTYLSRTLPTGREGEVFGLYATTGRAVSFVAPVAFAAAASLGGAQIFGILGIGLVLLGGLALFIPVARARCSGATTQPSSSVPTS